MKTNQLIKHKIYEIRRKKGISQEQMASLLNISINSYRKLERGKTFLVSERLWEISNVLEVAIEELVLDEDFEKGKSLADLERDSYNEQIDKLKREVDLLQQHIHLLVERNDMYTKRCR